MAFKLISTAAYQEFVEKVGQNEPAVSYPRWKETRSSFEMARTNRPEIGEPVWDKNYVPTVLPPKKYIYPSTNVLMKFEKGKVTEVPVDNSPLILIGVRPCDVNALNQMDRIYLDDIEDPYYRARRSSAIILGWDCYEHCDEYCFCESVGGLMVDRGYDLFFTQLQGKYNDTIVIRVGSDRGQELLNKYAQTKNITEDMIKVYERHQSDKLVNFEKRIHGDMSAFPLLFLGSYESPVWKEQGDLCYGCTACTVVCPTCSCFDVKDSFSSDMEGGERKRIWDSCMQPDFTQVAGGHNFRTTRRERLRHRMFRKFKFQMQQYGMPYCTGCGRCIRACLAAISPVYIINRLFELNLERRQAQEPNVPTCPIEKEQTK